MRGALISVRPHFAESILAGMKTSELRRRAPLCMTGDAVVLYETKPTMAIVGLAVVEMVEFETTQRLWPSVRHSACVSRREYGTYFSGSTHAYAIHLRSARAFKSPIALHEVRQIIPHFQPPQSWCYLASLPSALVKKIERAARC